MVSPINTALSGLAAAGKRLEVSANNIANQSSSKSRVDGQTVDTPYVPQRVQQVSQEGGGVLARVVDANPPTIKVFDPESPDHTVELPNVDIARELVNQKIASYDYKANLKTIKVADEIQKSLLDIIS